MKNEATEHKLSTDYKLLYYKTKARLQSEFINGALAGIAIAALYQMLSRCHG